MSWQCNYIHRDWKLSDLCLFQIMINGRSGSQSPLTVDYSPATLGANIDTP